MQAETSLGAFKAVKQFKVQAGGGAMRGQQGHQYLSVGRREKTRSSLSRKCRKAKIERRDLRELHVRAAGS